MVKRSRSHRHAANTNKTKSTKHYWLGGLYTFINFTALSQPNRSLDDFERIIVSII